MKKLKFLIFLSGCFLSSGILGQSISSDVISNSGENFTGNNFSLNWTLGESVVDVLANDPLIHTQGFHQTYVKLGDPSEDLLKSSISVFPNPAADFVNIEMRNFVKEDMTIELFDLSGKKLYSKEIDPVGIFKLNMKPYSEGKYILNVISGTQTTFGIIKSLK